MTDKLWDLLEMDQKAELEPSVDGHGLTRKVIDLSEQVRGVERAFTALYNSSDGPWYYWVKTVFDEYVIVEHESEAGASTKWYQIAYSRGVDGRISFAPKAKWIEGKFVFQPPSLEVVKGGAGSGHFGHGGRPGKRGGAAGGGALGGGAVDERYVKAAGFTTKELEAAYKLSGWQSSTKITVSGSGTAEKPPTLRVMFTQRKAGQRGTPALKGEMKYTHESKRGKLTGRRSGTLVSLTNPTSALATTFLKSQVTFGKKKGLDFLSIRPAIAGDFSTRVLQDLGFAETKYGGWSVDL